MGTEQQQGTKFDAIIVGAGFSGLYSLKRLQELGLKVQVFETGGDVGGVWYWNGYPGARVDNECYLYQFSDPELWKDYHYNEKFPGRDEIVRYLRHVADTWGLRPHIQFGTTVTNAVFDSNKNEWTVATTTGDGHKVSYNCKYFILGAGFGVKKFTPQIKGMGDFKGELYHTGSWPLQDKVSFEGKKVGVIGTGPSGVQVIQTIAPLVASLKVYQRTPQLAYPMHQQFYTSSDGPDKAQFQSVFDKRRVTFTALDIDFIPRSALQDTEEERNKVYTALYEKGAFSPFAATYYDTLSDETANRIAYDFWAQRTRPRILDPVKRELLAPLTPPHFFGAKRPSLEETYFEAFNQDNVALIDINSSPIIEINERGIVTEKEGLAELDMIITATGFDVLTGSILSMDIANGAGLGIKNKWKEGTKTVWGLGVHGFPNMFILYGPQSPAGFTTAAALIEAQTKWLVQLLEKMRKEGKSKVEFKPELEDSWVKEVHDAWKMVLASRVDSWWNGSNIPGKVKEPMNYAGGMPEYIKRLETSSENGFQELSFN